MQEEGWTRKMKELGKRVKWIPQKKIAHQDFLHTYSSNRFK